jgi:hypothetical protein
MKADFNDRGFIYEHYRLWPQKLFQLGVQKLIFQTSKSCLQIEGFRTKSG